MLRVVVDTNVLFTGLTRRGSEADIIDAWAGRRFLPCVSTALALEYQATLGSKLGPRKKHLALPALQALLSRCEFVAIWYLYRPSSPDPGDDLVVECVLNSRSLLVTQNVRDFRAPARQLGFTVLKPAEFLDLLNRSKP